MHQQHIALGVLGPAHKTDVDLSQSRKLLNWLITYFIDYVHILVVEIIVLRRQQRLIIFVSCGGGGVIILNRMLSRCMWHLLVHKVLAENG